MGNTSRVYSKPLLLQNTLFHQNVTFLLTNEGNVLDSRVLWNYNLRSRNTTLKGTDTQSQC